MPTRSFTLIEVLVVIAIIGALSVLVLTALSDVQGKALRAQAQVELSDIAVALENYRSTEGRYPRTAPRPAGAALGDGDAYRDDCVGLWIGLMNKPTTAAGGGPGAPYLDGWDPQQVGLYAGGPAGLDAGLPTQPDGTNLTSALPQSEALSLGLLPYQLQHLPGQATQLVLLDPWGNPYHYREWASIRDGAKDAAIASPRTRSLSGIKPSLDRQGQRQPVPSVSDLPYAPASFVLWSNGPNGINEYGHPDSDDVVSWRK